METTDPAFYTDAKYWNREYRNAMISMHIGRPIMGQRVVDILTLLDFCSEHEFLKGHSVKVFANGIYGPAAIHAAYLDERINSVEITHSVKTWKEYIESEYFTHPCQGFQISCITNSLSNLLVLFQTI